MAGNDGKGKYITPPEDVLEPAWLPPDHPVEEGCHAAEHIIRILEDQNGCLYINPDAQHIGMLRESSDILRIYSREIQALRKIASLQMGVITNLLKQMPPGTEGTALGDHYNKVIEYLQNASWELTLVNDPLFPIPPPG